MANVISLPYSTSSGTYGSTLSNTYQWYVQWYQYPTITDTMKSSNAYMKINSIKKNSFIKKNLQEGYTHVKYIESTGTQYIDTQYIPNSNTRIIMDFQSTQVPSGWFGFFSSRDGSSNSYANQFALWMNSSGVFRSNYYTDTGIYLDSSISSTGRHIIDHNKNIVTMDDVVVATHTATTFNGTYNLFLFAGHTGGTMELPSSMKLYSCKIYDNDILIRDYVPCVNANGIAGLYDLVNHVFYQNSGSGNFIIDENESDDITANISIYSQNAITRTGTNGYTASTFTFKSQPTILLYNKTLGTSIPIYNVALTTTVADNGTGATVSSSITHSSTINVNIPESWFEEENRYWYFTISDILTIVDTSSTLTNTKTFETFVVDALYDVFVRKDVKLPDGYAMLSYIEGTGTQYIDTGFKPNENTRLVLDIDIGTQSSYPMALLGSRNGDTNSNASFVIFIMTASQFRTDFGSSTANANISTSGRFLIDKNKSTCNINGTLYENTNTTFQSDYTLSILTENDPSGYDTRITKGKIYSCQIYDNDILIRDYIPCLNPSNIAGLYDLVNGVFYGDSAGGTFLFGLITGSAQSSQTNARLYKAVNVWVKKDGILYPMKSVYSKVGG